MVAEMLLKTWMMTTMESRIQTIPATKVLGWISTAITDYDGDGCKDDSEDLDDDDDGICDTNGPSSYGTASSVGLLYDNRECMKGDGCQDPETTDDDNDGLQRSDS